LCVGEYSDQKEFTIFYVGNKEGQVYKVAQWTQDGKLKYVLADSTGSSDLHNIKWYLKLRKFKKEEVCGGFRYKFQYS
jgi:hypothetical protein